MDALNNLSYPKLRNIIKNTVLTSSLVLAGASVSAQASDVSDLNITIHEKFPFLKASQDFSDEGYDVSEYHPYVGYAYSEGYIDDNDILFSLEAHGKLYDWLLTNRARRFIVVNIPAYELYVFSSDSEFPYIDTYTLEWETNVVVGSPYYKTPLTPFEIVSLKYNPTWTPTYNIMKRNARTEDGEWNMPWIEGHNFSLLDRETREPLNFEEAKEYPLSDILLVEPKGASNSLGKLKFETTSNSNIYLHDTNEKWFFDKEDRARSSGCIRVENPNYLASLLAEADTNYIENNISKDSTYWEAVNRTPVFFMYDNVEYRYNNVRDLHKLDDPYGYFKKFIEEQSSDFYVE